MLKSELVITLNKKHEALSSSDIEHILDLFFNYGNKTKYFLFNNSSLKDF